MKKSNLILSAALAGLIAGSAAPSFAHNHKEGSEKKAEKNKCKADKGEKHKCGSKNKKDKKSKEMACGENGCGGH